MKIGTHRSASYLAGLAGDYETYLVDWLVDAIDNAFPTGATHKRRVWLSEHNWGCRSAHAVDYLRCYPRT